MPLTNLSMMKPIIGPLEVKTFNMKQADSLAVAEKWKFPTRACLRGADKIHGYCAIQFNSGAPLLPKSRSWSFRKKSSVSGSISAMYSSRNSSAMSWRHFQRRNLVSQTIFYEPIECSKKKFELVQRGKFSGEHLPSIRPYKRSQFHALTDRYELL